MKQFIKILFLFVTCSTFAQPRLKTFKPGEIWPDNNGVHINAHGGGFLYYNETYYWFGEHKISGELGNRAMVGIHAYSSKDLYNWKDEGIVLKMHEDTISMFQKGCTLERPKVVYNKKNKKFVMWFHHELKGQSYQSALAGIAVSDYVTGPFKYITSFRLHPNSLPTNFSTEQLENAELVDNVKDEKNKQKIIGGAYFKRDYEMGQMSRDMTIFVDEDDTAYHITASEENQTLLISKLSDDYLSLTKEFIRIFPGGRNEAPAIFKKGNHYFMFTSDLTGWKPNPARLAVSKSIMGEWEFVGNPCRGDREEKNNTFWSQSTFVIPVYGKKDAFIFAADRWRPENPIDGSYVWLPIKFKNNLPFLEWKDSWNLSIFKK